MEKLRYIVEDSILAELLGVQNFSTKESAVLELIKNAYDACAINLKIKISKYEIEIADDGIGMNREDLTSGWMHIGKSNKQYEIEDIQGRKRIQAGSKGVGRFALARLGKNVELYSHKEGDAPIRWITDWNSSELYEDNLVVDSIGTRMVITDLRDSWKKTEVENLSDYIGRTYCENSMKIELSFENQIIPIKRIFENPEIGKNFSEQISLNYSAEKKILTCDIKSDEFKDDAQAYCKNNIYSFSVKIDLIKENLGEEFDVEPEDIDDLLENLGDFSADFYFGIDRALKGDDERFLYKRVLLPDRYKYGIILYRNAFSISSYEGKKDWLGLGKRSRMSPAAATHPTGNWRVRENQISGIVNIDKKRNVFLQDLANRQGIDENIYYKLFVKIIHLGLEEFERYRQSLIRDINEKNKKQEWKAEQTISSMIVNKPNKIYELTKNQQKQLVGELKNQQKEKQKFEKSLEDTETRYKYDVRILNVLATSGLKATSIAHEMKNDRNKIDGNYEFVVEALKKYDMWDELCEPENTRIAHLNVPELLKKNRDTSIKLLQFMDVMLEEVEKRQFIPEDYNIKELLDKVKNNWEKDYAWVRINLNIGEDVRFFMPEDVITVIFDNLILNSIQQNEKKNKLEIDIEIQTMGGILTLIYRDNGNGLPEQYKSNPMKILEPHVTSRKKGHGLGMWIVNNTLDMSGGKVQKIYSEGGFRMDFTIGGKL